MARGVACNRTNRKRSPRGFRARVRFRARQFCRRKRVAASPLPEACCFIFVGEYRASSCWYLCWYRQQSTTKAVSNSNGYGS